MQGPKVRHRRSYESIVAVTGDGGNRRLQTQSRRCRVLNVLILLRVWCRLRYSNLPRIIGNEDIMAGRSITFENENIDAALTALFAAAGDVTPALQNIGEYGGKSTRRRFIDETDPEGKPWQALNALYARTKKGPGKLRGETRTLSQIVWQLADDNGVEWGSNEVYARIHNEGGDIVPKSADTLVFSMGGQTFHVKKVTIPKRQFLGTNAQDIEEILGIVQDHFIEAVEVGSGTP